MLINTLFIAALIAAVTSDIDLTIRVLSQTIHKEWCMNDCQGGKCITGPDRVEKSCTVGTQQAPTYFTSQVNGRQWYCLSRCGYYGSEYQWCYTTKDGSWDYCSSQVRSPATWVKGRRFTLKRGPCKDFCTRSADNVHRCTSVWGDVTECNNKGLNYWQAKTVYGKDCQGTCSQHEGANYYWCYDPSETKKYCANPARERKHSQRKQKGGNHYKKNNQGYKPNNQRYQTNNQGYQTGHQGYQSSNQGFQTSNLGYQSSNQGYPSSNQGFSFSNQGYPSSNQGYAASNQGYAFSQQGYPSSSQGFQTGNQGYQASNQGSQTSNQGSQTSNQGYQTSNQDYEPSDDDFQISNQG